MDKKNKKWSDYPEIMINHIKRAKEMDLDLRNIGGYSSNKERIIIRDAVQIPLIGATFERVNICVFQNINQLSLNLQRGSNPENDEPHFLTIEQVNQLINELKKGLKTLEEII